MDPSCQQKYTNIMCALVRKHCCEEAPYEKRIPEKRKTPYAKGRIHSGKGATGMRCTMGTRIYVRREKHSPENFVQESLCEALASVLL